MPKDIADIHVLLKSGLGIKKALLDADSKVAGVSPLLIAKILTEFNYILLDTEVKWVTPVPGQELKKFLSVAAQRIVKGKE